MLFLEYPKCSTCKRAKAWLEAEGIPFEDRDIKTANPTAAELALWERRSGKPVAKLFNTSGILYREQKLKEKIPTLTEEERFELLASDGMLVKRPLLIGDDFVLIGFREQEWKQKLCPHSGQE